uniref:Phosphomannomutase n=1 Tax=Panagrolaimus superbus TaxID=310955 RepID=A0A914Y1F1_9BILA
MSRKTILLFDVDGTLTAARQSITQKMREFMQETHKKVHLAVVGGSDLNKITEQLGDIKDLCHEYDYVFSENGLVGYHGTEKLPDASIGEKIGEDKLQDVINFSLEYLSKIRLPLKRGTFIEYRKGMLNISPIGRSCSLEERNGFIEYEKKHPVRMALVAELERRFSNYGLKFSIGGQISVDVFPVGWDKTYCLKYLNSEYDTIHFFGDKTMSGGNDYEIYEHPRTIGHTVTNPEDTIAKVKNVLENL